MDESGGGQDWDPGQDFCEERWRRVNKGKERMDNQWRTGTRGKRGKRQWNEEEEASVSYRLLVLFSFLLLFPFRPTLVVNELTDSCSITMQCNPAMRLADQSRRKPALAIQRAAAVVKGHGFGRGRGRGDYKSRGQRAGSEREEISYSDWAMAIASSGHLRFCLRRSLST